MDGNDSYSGLRPVIIVSKDKIEPTDIIGNSEFYQNKMITIADEDFYIIEIKENSVRLLAAQCVNTATNRQSTSPTNIKFDQSGEEQLYANSSIKTLVDNYVSALQTRWGKTITSGGLLKPDDYMALNNNKALSGDQHYVCNESDFPDYFNLGISFWLDFDNPIYSYDSLEKFLPAYIYYWSEKGWIAIYGDSGNGSYALRPVIEVPKSCLQE